MQQASSLPLVFDDVQRRRFWQTSHAELGSLSCGVQAMIQV